MATGFFFQYHGKKILLVGLVAAILFAVGFYTIRPAIDAINHRAAVNRFNNMTRDDMISDFEYLMTTLEENWPFFNISISANGVDVRELADNTRTLLNNPATDINCPFDFLHIVQEYFFEPINQLGHLRQIFHYEDFFATRARVNLEIEQGRIDRLFVFFHEVFNRPESVLFYDRLRDTGRGGVMPPPRTGPVMEFDILEDGRIAYMGVNRMINIWQDTWRHHTNMWHYEGLTYRFSQDIEGYEHLIIDFRGNRGGLSMHFRSLIMPQFLRDGIGLHAYAFYMDGEYAALAREVFDIRSIFPPIAHSELEDNFVPPEVHFSEPLPYLDPNADFAHAISSFLHIIPVYHYYGVMNSARQDTLFDGKIWLLTDGETASAAEGVVAILKYNEIVTVVGEPTWGIMGTSFEPNTMYLTMPNTGIIVRFDVAYYTDPYGRPFQGYGIQPHYFPRPGMDALETVLAMIEEGSC